MNKFSSTEKKSEAFSLINDIVTCFNKSKIHEIPEKCNTLVTHIYAYSYILYTDLSEYFTSCGILKVLMNSLDKIEETPKRDVLRLIHLLLQVKRVLRDEARQSSDFQSFLLKKLEKPYCWENRLKFKHHINIASQLMVDRDCGNCAFNTASVRQLARSSIESIIVKGLEEDENALPSVIFYACSMFASKFEEVSIVDESISEKILSKPVIGKYSDFLRDYVQEFKKMYDTLEEGEISGFIFYKAKPGYSFQQLCHTFIYYAEQSKDVRMNIFQNGVYLIINNFLSIKFIPESLLLCGIDFLNLSLLDDDVLKGVKSNFQKLIVDKLISIKKREKLTENTKLTIQYIIDIYDTPSGTSFDIPSGEIIKPPRKIQENASLIHFTNINQKDSNVSDSFGIQRWGTLDVQEWLAENNLEDLKLQMSHLSGMGLNQLVILAKEKDKMQVVDFLMAKLKSSFDITLELIAALYKL